MNNEDIHIFCKKPESAQKRLEKINQAYNTNQQAIVDFMFACLDECDECRNIYNQLEKSNKDFEEDIIIKGILKGRSSYISDIFEKLKSDILENNRIQEALVEFFTNYNTQDVNIEKIILNPINIISLMLTKNNKLFDYASSRIDEIEFKSDTEKFIQNIENKNSKEYLNMLKAFILAKKSIYTKDLMLTLKEIYNQQNEEDLENLNIIFCIACEVIIKKKLYLLMFEAPLKNILNNQNMIKSDVFFLTFQKYLPFLISQSELLLAVDKFVASLENQEKLNVINRFLNSITDSKEKHNSDTINIFSFLEVAANMENEEFQSEIFLLVCKQAVLEIFKSIKNTDIKEKLIFNNIIKICDFNKDIKRDPRYKNLISGTLLFLIFDARDHIINKHVYKNYNEMIYRIRSVFNNYKDITVLESSGEGKNSCQYHFFQSIVYKKPVNPEYDVINYIDLVFDLGVKYYTYFLELPPLFPRLCASIKNLKLSEELVFKILNSLIKMKSLDLILEFTENGENMKFIQNNSNYEAFIRQEKILHFLTEKSKKINFLVSGKEMDEGPKTSFDLNNITPFYLSEAEDDSEDFNNILKKHLGNEYIKEDLVKKVKTEVVDLSEQKTVKIKLQNTQSKSKFLDIFSTTPKRSIEENSSSTSTKKYQERSKSMLLISNESDSEEEISENEIESKLEKNAEVTDEVKKINEESLTNKSNTAVSGKNIKASVNEEIIDKKAKSSVTKNSLEDLSNVLVSEKIHKNDARTVLNNKIFCKISKASVDKKATEKKQPQAKKPITKTSLSPVDKKTSEDIKAKNKSSEQSSKMAANKPTEEKNLLEDNKDWEQLSKSPINKKISQSNKPLEKASKSAVDKNTTETYNKPLKDDEVNKYIEAIISKEPPKENSLEEKLKELATIEGALKNIIKKKEDGNSWENTSKIIDLTGGEHRVTISKKNIKNEPAFFDKFNYLNNTIDSVMNNGNALIPPKNITAEKRPMSSYLEFCTAVLEYDKVQKPNITRLPNVYKSYEEYFYIFESLRNEECAATVNKGIDEGDTKKSITGVTSNVVYTKNTIEIEINIKGSCLNELDMVFITSEIKTGRVNDLLEANKGFLALVGYCRNTDCNTFIAKRNVSIPMKGSLVKIIILENFTTSFREYQSLRYILTSSLLPIILDPRKNVDSKPYGINKNLRDVLIKQEDLNVSQATAILNCCLSNKPIHMIQGPPGTGKTKTIISLIKTIFSGHMETSTLPQNLKLLICAPSNGAIDEITRRLTTNLVSLEGIELQKKILRLGVTAATDKNITNYTIEAHIEKVMKANNNSVPGGILNLRKAIITDADVVCCTLSTSGHEMLQYKQFNVLIVDESCQSTELSTIIPLRFSFEKIILIGDPKQLPPTVLSGNSVLEYTFFERFCYDVPALFLNTQYRMNKKIADIASTIFYDRMLLTSPLVANVQNTYNISPLTFFDIKSTEIKDLHSSKNTLEATAIAQLVAKLLEANPEYTLGIITPYRSQVTEIKACISEQITKSLNKFNFEQTNLEINTIDGYQGKEKDVIIMSCVRTNTLGFTSDPRRINVAITRAKKCLIIVGYLPLLTKDNIWKKVIDLGDWEFSRSMAFLNRIRSVQK